MDNTIKNIVIPITAALLSLLFLYLVRSLSFRFLHRWARGTETNIDDLVIADLRTPSLFWCMAIGLYIGISLSELPGKYIFYLSRTIYVMLIFSVTIAASNIAGRLFRTFLQKSAIPIPGTGLVYGLLKGSIIIIGILIILAILGISITPLITALGVGGLAVALALQDTLSNLFSGIHIIMEKSIRVGDFIRLETGQEGYVEDITWRTTRVRMLSNNMVIIPNNKLSQSVVTNYYLPEKRMSIQILFRVGYETDPENVERIIAEEMAGAVQEVRGLLKSPEPTLTLSPGFGESSLDFTLTCHVAEVGDQAPVQHELRKRILRRLRKEGLEMPFPQRTVHFSKKDTAPKA